MVTVTATRDVTSRYHQTGQLPVVSYLEVNLTTKPKVYSIAHRLVRATSNALGATATIKIIIRIYAQASHYFSYRPINLLQIKRIRKIFNDFDSYLTWSQAPHQHGEGIDCTSILIWLVTASTLWICDCEQGIGQVQDIAFILQPKNILTRNH